MVTLGTNNRRCYTEVTLLYSQVSMQLAKWKQIWGLNYTSTCSCYRVADQLALTQVSLYMYTVILLKIRHSNFVNK